jgi:hypothetical protein
MSRKPMAISLRFADATWDARLGVVSFRPERASQARATSKADFPIAPTVSKKGVRDRTPRSEVDPGVSFKAYRPATADGDTKEPVVSWPRATGANPQATLTADPVEEP